MAISDSGLSTSVEVSGGAMRINGEETEAGAELFAAALSQLGDSGALASDADTSDFPSEALYDNVSLVTGFTPDPYLVSIVAGGDSAASEELGTTTTSSGCARASCARAWLQAAPGIGPSAVRVPI